MWEQSGRNQQWLKFHLSLCVCLDVEGMRPGWGQGGYVMGFVSAMISFVYLMTTS